MPWNSITLVATVNAAAKATTCFTVGDAQKLFARQTKLLAESIAIRVQRVKFWETSGAAIFVSIDETPDGSSCASQSDLIKQLGDYPGKNTWACCGYEWPINSKLQSKTQAETSTVLFRYGTDKAGSVLIYLDVLWTAANAAIHLGMPTPLGMVEELDN